MAQKHTHKSGKPSASIAKKPKKGPQFIIDQARHTTTGIDHDADMEDGSCDEHTDCDENNSVKESDTEDDNLFKPPSSVLLSQNSVFTKAIREYFDCLAKKFGWCLQHQSDCLFARAYFPSGITRNNMKHGHEERSVSMLCLLIMLSKHGDDFIPLLDPVEKCSIQKGNDQPQSHKCSQGFIELFSVLLLFENFIDSREVCHEEIDLFGEYVPHFLEWYKCVVNKTNQMGMRKFKFHCSLHSASDLLRIGPLYSCDSSTGESNHKLHKIAARHTSMNGIHGLE